MIRVLDVFEHQFPVAADLLAHVSQDAQGTAVEYAIEVIPHGLAQVLAERRHGMIERGEDDAIHDLDIEFLKAVIGKRKVRGHASDAAIAGWQAIAERNADQPAFEVVVPLMINALQRLGVPVRVAADLLVAVSELVDHREYGAFAV